MADLLELAARVEGLDGPSREVDALIAWTLHWRWDGWEEGDLKIEERPLEYVIERIQRGHKSIWINLPRYTGSMDAAMTLVPEGWDFRVERFRADECCAWCWLRGNFDDALLCYEAPAPALALVAASLKALAVSCHNIDEGSV